MFKKMKNKNLILIVAAAVLIAAGCREPSKSVLSAEPTSLNFTVAGGESKTFEVTSNLYWTISDPPSWLDISPSSGSGIETVTVKAKSVNTTNGVREGKINITATDVPTVTVNVIQDAPVTVDIATISGVTAPETGFTIAASAIKPTDQYTGSVKWETTDASFVARKAYTATITLTPEAGFMFAGVAVNYFKVTGATTTNDAGSGVIKAVFPATPDGTANYPFLVATAADLQKIGAEGVWSLSSHYRQVANITLNGNWTPIGNGLRIFSGSYDGGGYSISNLTISVTTAFPQGFFGNLTGAVRNVALRNVNINSTGTDTGATVGGIAGYVSGGTVENCYVTGNLSGSYSAGGVTGWNYNGVIKNCYTTCDVKSGRNFAGGIVGSFDYETEWGERPESKITYCYATGKISGTNYVGGILGGGGGGSTRVDYDVERCVALNSEVSASAAGANVGRIVGTTSTKLSNNFARENGMKLTSNGANVTQTSNAAGIHGANVNADNMNGVSSVTWWSNTYNAPGFSTALWTFAINRLPHLKTTTGGTFNETQDPEIK